MICDICGSTETYVKNHHHVYTIKGKEITFNSERRFCSKCNNLVYDNKLDNIASKKAIQTYNDKYGLDKEKIVELRKKYNLSLELFSKIIGCAKKTLISYEKGTSIPNDSYLTIIKSLISNPSLISNYIEVNKQQFTDKEYNRINSKLSSFLKNNTKQLFLNEECELSEYNGYTKLDKNKVYNVILYLIDESISKTKLLKEMFYVDFLFYKKSCKSLTGLEYCKLPYGPVPDEFEEILNNGYNAKIISCDYKIKNGYESIDISKKKQFDKSVFCEEELKVLEYVKKHFKNYNVKNIVDFSHKENAYTQTKDYNKISYDYSFDIDFTS